MKFLKAIRRVGGSDTDIEIPYSESEGGVSQSGAVTLLGPFTCNFDTPNFVNPDGFLNGINTLAIPAGSFVQSFVIITEDWVGVETGDELDVSLIDAPDGTGVLLARYSATNFGATTPAVGFNEPAIIIDGSPSHSNWSAAIAVVDCHIVTGLFAANPVTTGSLDIYALVATPT